MHDLLNKKNIIFGLLCAILIIVIVNFHIDYSFNGLSDRVNYIINADSLLKNGYLLNQQIRLPLFFSYVLFYCNIAFGFKSILICSLFFIFLTIIGFVILLKKSIGSKYLLSFFLLFFFNIFVLNLLKGLYAEVISLPLLCFGLFCIGKHKYTYATFFFLCISLIKVEMILLLLIWLLYYLLYIAKNKKSVLFQYSFFCLAVFTLFGFLKVSYFEIYYGFNINGLFLLCLLLFLGIFFLFLYGSRSLFITRATKKYYQTYAIIFFGYFFIISPLLYVLLGGSFDEKLIIKNTNDATDLDLINIYRIIAVVGVFPIIACIQSIKKILHIQVLHTSFRHVLYFGLMTVTIFCTLFFLESFHEPNLIIWMRRLYILIIPITVLSATLLLYNYGLYFRIIYIFLLVNIGLSFNAHQEYKGYTDSINTMVQVINEKCLSKTILFDKDVYAYESMLLSLSSVKNIILYDKNTYENNKNDCLLLPKRLIQNNQNLISDKTIINEFLIGYERYSYTLFSEPKNKEYIEFIMTLYK